jgi:competence protein ComEC
MRCAILGFALGTGLLQLSSELPQRQHVLAGLMVALLLLGLRRLVPAILAAILLGYCWAALLAFSALSHALPHSLEGEDIVVTGVVDKLPHEFSDGVRFRFAVESSSKTVPPRLMLGWYRQAGLMLLPGERWQLTVRLKRAHGNANPYGFDYEAWLLEQGVRATGYVRAGKRVDRFVFTLSNALERWRSALRSSIQAELVDRRYAGVIVALVVGDQRAIDQSDWTVFNRTGISHLVSISGLHITMIAGMCAWIASALWRRSLFTAWQLPLLVPAQKVAVLVGALSALFYVALAGFGVPAQRTLYMLIVVALAMWTGRLPGVSHILCLALGVVVLIDPWSVMWPGFWLSFGAVAAILYATGEPARGWRGTLMMAVRTQWAVTVGLVPLTMLLFAQVSIISPVANVIAIPVVSFVVTPLALAGSLLLGAGGLLGLAHWSMEALAALLGALAAQPFAVWSAPAPSWPAFLIALAGTIWMISPAGGKWRILGCLAWVPMLFARPSSPPANSAELTFFDVGQGSAVLIETHRHRLLVDTGPAYTLDANGGNRVILPYLRHRGIAALDGLIVTHSDLDHSGGARAVGEGVDVRWTLSSMAGFQRCSKGQRWEWDGVRFEILHPAGTDYSSGAKPNAMSCVLSVSVGSHRVLLPGDIEAAQELSLVREQSSKLASLILLVPHHGSGTSSTVAFLKAVKPQLAIFQVGYRNRYQHPKAEVLKRYQAMGIDVARTDDSGAVTVRLGRSMTVERYRETHRRYWY